MKTDIPGYKIIRTLGRGGMATVYLAIQQSFEREVALKVMSLSLSADPTFSERFLREAHIVSRLVHPNIVTVYDVGVHKGQHFLSMEYVPGEDLKQKRFKLSRGESLRMVKEVAKALDFASKKGYVHRDVKPENIMLHEEDGRAVLMDFGIARAANSDSDMTQTGTAIGTPHYMSPEQAKGKPVDSRSDIYSLGVVLYLILAGHVPYDGDSAVAVGIKHVSEPIPQLPPSLRIFQGIIDKLLAKDPEKRFQHGAELIAALDGITEEDLKVVEALEAEAERTAFGAVDDNSPTVVGPAAVGRGKTTFEGGDATAVRMRPVAVDAAKKGGQRRKITSVKKTDHPASTNRNKLHNTSRAVTEEVMTVPVEDRIKYASDDKPKPAAWPWFVGSIVIVVAAGIFFQQPIQRYLLQHYPAEFQRLQALVSGGSTATETLTQRQSTDSAASQQTQNTTATPTVEHADAASSPLQTGSGITIEQMRLLRQQLESDPKVAPRLAQAYRDTLAQQPDNQQARWGLQQLKEYYIRQVRENLDAGEFEKAQTFIASAKLSFPNVAAEAPKYARLLARVEKYGRIRDLLEQGEKYLSNDDLTSPMGANALESFQDVLAEDEHNEQALQGLTAIAQRYGELARERVSRGELARAKKFINQGLLVQADNEQLQDVNEEIDKKMARREQLRRRQKALLTQAQQLFDKGQLIEPNETNALDRYRAVLALNKGNAEAKRGVAAVEKALLEAIDTLIFAAQLESAQTQLGLAREKFTSSNKLLVLQAKLDKVFEDRAFAALPKIPKVIISSAQLADINVVQQDMIKVERTIHIGFRYKNFDQTTSVVQAILYDGARSLQIAQVPVIVTGQEGVTFFRIDRPVEGFAGGGYNIDLIVGDDRLTTATFNVEHIGGH